MKNPITLEFLREHKVSYVEEQPIYPALILTDSESEPKIVKYAVSALNNLRISYQNYCKNNNDFGVIRSIFHGFYNTVHSNSIDTFYVSESYVEEKRLNKKYVGCKDHFYIPQNLGRICYGYPDKYLKEFDEFCQLFYTFTQTRLITPEENRRLSKYTKSGKNINGKKIDNLQFLCSLEERYEKAGIKLLERTSGRNWYNKELKSVSNKIELNKELKEFEQLYINREF